LCLHCEEEGKVVPADVVDHIKPIKQGGAKLSHNNIQSLCHSCHNKKTYEENNPQVQE
jgi:5-methylcytosine-specific restriction protein A